MNAVVSLTDRQRQVLALIGEGLTYDEIGSKLDISPRTAKAHTDRLRFKFGVRFKRELITHARTMLDELEHAA